VQVVPNHSHLLLLGVHGGGNREGRPTDLRAEIRAPGEADLFLDAGTADAQRGRVRTGDPRGGSGAKRQSCRKMRSLHGNADVCERKCWRGRKAIICGGW
jgi:hypothetical protein